MKLLAGVVEFYVTADNEAKYNVLYKKLTSGKVITNNPSSYLLELFGCTRSNITTRYSKKAGRTVGCP